MAQTSGFFDAEELVGGGYDREYVAEQWANYFKLFIGNGVFSSPTNQLKVVAYTGMHVKLSVGWAFINGYWYHNDTDLDIEIPANVTASSRTDGIFIQWNSSERTVTAVVGEGRTAVNRIAPYYELKVAEVVVGTGTTEITDAVITDTRADSSVCGFVTGVVDVIDSTNLFAQFTAIFESWYNSSQTEFEAWFEEMKDQLSEDAAGHLQEEIDDIRTSMVNVEACTDEEYEELSESELLDGTMRIVGDEDEDYPLVAAVVGYDNTDSGLTAEDTQAAIDELSRGVAELMNPTPDITYTATANMTGAQVLDWLRANVDFSKLNIRSKISVGDAIFSLWVNNGSVLSAYAVSTHPTYGTISVAFQTAYSGSTSDRWSSGSSNVLTYTQLNTGNKLKIFY